MYRDVHRDQDSNRDNQQDEPVSIGMLQQSGHSPDLSFCPELLSGTTNPCFHRHHDLRNKIGHSIHIHHILIILRQWVRPLTATPYTQYYNNTHSHYGNISIPHNRNINWRDVPRNREP